MKIRDLIVRAKYEPRTETCIYTIAERLGIYETLEFDEEGFKRLTECYITKWLCTDQFVGMKAYFLDDNFICCSNQSARKSDMEFTFQSASDYNELRKFILSFSEVEDSYLKMVNPDFFEQEMSPSYSVHYTSQILPSQHKLSYQGQPVGYVCDPDKKSLCSKRVCVKTPENEERIVDVEDLNISYF